MNAVAAYLRSLRPQLPRAVWLLEAGGVANAVGNGIVLPFLIIYLHEVRGFDLEASGLVVAALFGVGLVSGPIGGHLVDRIGARATLLASLAMLAAGYGGFPFVRDSWQAFELAILAGAGNGGFAPSHSSLLAALTSREQRNVAYALHRATDNLGYGVGGLVGGLIATTSVPESFTVLFALDAGTFVAFMLLLAFVPAPARASEPRAVPGRYADVAHDRAYIWLLALIAVLVAAGYAQISTVLPPYVKEHAGVSELGIGIVFFANTVVIVLAQLPVAKALEGRRRLGALAFAAATFAATCTAVLGVGLWLAGTTAVIALCGAIAVFSVGECVHGAVQNPLVADLAPEHLLGRYMALRSSAWQVGFLVGPGVGALLLEHSASGLWLTAAGACGLTALGFLLLERRLPAEATRTPGPAWVARKAFRVKWRTLPMRIDDPLSTGAQPASHQATEASHARGGRRPTA